MRDYYKAVRTADPNREAFSAIVLNGVHAGERAVFSGEEAVYLSDPEGFIKKHYKELSPAGPGIVRIDETDIFKECIGHRKHMVICGCGHVSIPIIRLAKTIGFYITAVDDRPEFVRNAVEAGADEGIGKSFEEALESIPGDGFTYYVVVTRGHSYDEECLKIISAKPHAYIGAMGSRRRIDIVRQNLIKEGADENIIRSIHSPIGLDIRSETPEEIAVSVLAEIIEIKNRKRDTMIPGDIFSEILGTAHTPPYSGRMVLSTIIEREGSAPREVGARMLLRDDGKAVNTIGGGLMESRVLEKSRKMLEEGIEGPVCETIELNADEASRQGEVCGGTLKVLMEVIK